MTEADRNARVEEIGAKLFQLDGSRGYSLSCLAHGQEALDDLEFVFKALKATQAELDRLKAERVELVRFVQDNRDMENAWGEYSLTDAEELLAAFDRSHHD